IYDWSHQPKPEPAWPDSAHAYNRWLHEYGVTWEGLYRKRKVAGYPEQYNAGMPADYHELAWESERTLRYIEGGLKAPWFASINIFAPHNPFDPAPEYLEKMRAESLPMPLYRDGEEREQARFAGVVAHQTRNPAPPGSYPARHMKACYYAMIEHVDWYVGKVLDALERSGQRDNTLVIFMSDHGEMLGDHGLRLKGCRFFEGAVRVPLILSWPSGGIQRGVQNDALVELTDMAPTLLEAAGVRNPGDMDGSSLLPLARGTAKPAAYREFVWSEYRDSQTNELKSHASMIRVRRYKLTLYHGTGLGELFDLEADPEEFSNLFEKPEHIRLRQRMTDRLLDTLALHADLGSPRIGVY
ncbi:MAG: sulfatase-like hydrolase/transferase, partial [Bryobacterales bacterium]|nr:sulfatase-like hydrolase/transferase [Bryobacterales bacterium]